MSKENELTAYYQGDNDIVTKWLNEFKSVLCGTAYNILKDSHLVEDVFNDLYLMLAGTPASQRKEKFRPNNFNIRRVLIMRIANRSKDVKRNIISKRIDDSKRWYSFESNDGEKRDKKESLEELHYLIDEAKKRGMIKPVDHPIIEYMLKGWQNQSMAVVLDTTPAQIAKRKHRIIRQLKRLKVQLLN